MATVPMTPAMPGLQPGAPQQQQQQQPQTMEHTASSPMQGAPDDPQNSNLLTPEDQQKCIALVRRYKAQWQQDRMLIMQRCLENMEFFKGNQYVSFDPTNFQFFDAVSYYQDQYPGDSDDTELLRHCNNFYQMLATGFVAALSPQVPKSVFLPENAEVLEDVATAQASQVLIDVIERQNKEKSILKQQLLYLFTCGATFRHTRYLVDADLAGTHPEPVFGVVDTEIMPSRYHCFNCGTDNNPGTMALAMSRNCQGCDSPLGPESYYPAVNGKMVQQTGTEDVANGQVTWTCYSPLQVDCDPSANNLRQTPLLNLATEVHLAALRTAYPAMFETIKGGGDGAGLSQNQSIDRLARSAVTSQAAYTTAQGLDMRPTLDRTWIQPWAFALEDDQEFVARIKANFPDGMLLINVGETFLEARPAVLTKEWTWAGTHENLGLYPPAPGDVILPFQKRYNNACNMLDDFIERCSAGMTLVNVDLIDAKSVNGKPLLPGVLNQVKMKRTAPGQRLEDALYQFKFEMEEAIFEYLEKLMTNAQMFAGIPPQVYGGAGDPNVQTFGGQEQQLNVAMGKLNVYWDNIREEHAEADELAVKCAQDNLTDDMKQVVQERGEEFRNNYVRLDDLQGNIKAYPDTDQGFPISASELRQRWMDLLKEAAANPVAGAIFDEPENQQQAATALGIPGMIIPNAAMTTKVYIVLGKLLRGKPQPQVDPQTQQPTGQMMPSVMPDKTIDDWDTLKKIVRHYCQQNADFAETNPAGFQNILAYLEMASAMQTAYESQISAQKAEVAKAGMPQPPPPPPKPTIPPDELNETVGRLNDLMNLTPAQTGGNISGQVSAAGQLIKIGTSLTQ